MVGYIDLFLLPVPKKNLTAYKKIATAFSKIIKEYGALSYHEFAGDDLYTGSATSFMHNIKVKKDEVLVSAVVEYRSRKHRDQVNKKLMSDPRVKNYAEQMKKKPLHDPKRMLYGGFATIVGV